MIMSMGWILIFFSLYFMGKYARQNAAAQMPMLIHSWLSMPFGLKLAAFMSMIAAEAMSPTTTGRRPLNMAFPVSADEMGGI